MKLLLLENSSSTLSNKKRIAKKLYLGNLDAKRDWGHQRLCRSNVEKMLQKKTPMIMSFQRADNIQ